MSASERIDVDALKRAIKLEDLIADYGVGLKRHGKELRGLCPFHSERTPSFTVTPKTGLYYCMGCAAAGDHVSFIMEHDGLGFRDAAHRLAEITGGTVPANDNTPAAGKRRGKRKVEPSKPKWEKQSTAPDDAPPPPDSLRVLRGGEWIETPVVAAWAYHDAEGHLVGYTCRIEFQREDGTTAKDVIPLTWQASTETGECRWRQGAMIEPRPLYGADLLAQHPDWQVITVEGEKACDAGRRMLAGMPLVVVTWPGGCKAVDRADWSALAGRKVVGWPDCDSQHYGDRHERAGEMKPYLEQPGMGAMLRIAELADQHDFQMRIVAVPLPGEIADGWDLADGEAEGWGGARVLEELRGRLATVEELRAGNAHQPPDDADLASDDAPPPPEDAPTTAKRAPKEKPPRRPPPSPDEVDTERGPVRPLGYNHGRYYYLATRQRQVHEYQASAHTGTGLLQLAPLEYWSQAFAYGGEMKREHWQAAVDALMRLCERQGIFDTAIIRGRGCWIDTGRLVINLGNRLIVDGAEMPVDRIDSTMIYEAGARLGGPRPDPLTVAEARRVLEIAKRFNWEMPASAALLAGWIVLAPLCGALGWRPHIWLTGGTGTGKTTILNDYVAPLMAAMELQVQGNSTEAGIRQTLRADARPVLFDESEQNDDRETDRIQNVLSLVRQSSSESQSRTLKGTTTGRQLEFHIRSMFCLASIQVGIKRQADHTRISILSLYGTSQVPADQLEAHQDRWLDTERMLADLREDKDFAGRLVARSVAMFDTIRANMRTLIRVAAKEFRSQRLGDQYGTLLAGAASLINDGLISEDAALKFIRMFDWTTFHEASREDESADALTAIMQIEVQVELDRSRETRTVGELVAIAADSMSRNGISPTEANTYLGRMGLRVKRGIIGRDAGLLVANKSERLSKALRGAPWGADWRSYLRRLPGAKPHGMPIRFSEGYSSRAVFVPIGVVLPGDSVES